MSAATATSFSNSLNSTRNWRLSPTPKWQPHRPSVLVPRASGKGGKKPKSRKPIAPPSTETESTPTTQQQQQVSLSLEDVNPVGLGRKSRQIFDEVWRKFSGLGQISRTTRADDQDTLDALLIREGPMCEFAIPGAQNTTVLVVGATSRIGRLVVRKLMLRGYTVKVSCSSQSIFNLFM